ncbi:MAG: amino acid permease [Vicinamibacterales bacterium]|nr:amino acid permease [Vicinamibacterales bacterium]
MAAATEPPSPAGAPGAPPRLERVVGLAGLTAIAVNGVVGSGIFVLPATVALILGPASPVAYLVAALLTALVVLCFAEAGSRTERTGGPYVYAREAFGPFVGFQVGWLFFLTRLTAAAAIANAFVAYLGVLWPAASAGLGRAAVLAALIGSFAAANAAGIRHGAFLVNALTVAKLLPLLFFVGVGLAYADPSRYDVLTIPPLAGLREASLLLIFAFGGFENASVPAEEVKQPRRNVPIALLLAIAATTVLYVLIQIVTLGTYPDLAGDPAPLASSARAFLGPAGALLLTAGAVLSTAGSISALSLVGPRILYALSVGGQFPRAFGLVHPRWHTPHVSIAVFAAATLLIAIWGSFAQLAAASVVARLIFSAVTCLAVPVLRRKQGSEPAQFVIPGGMTVPLLATAVSLWLLSGMTEGQVMGGGIAIAVGTMAYGVARRRDRS